MCEVRWMRFRSLVVVLVLVAVAVAACDGTEGASADSSVPGSVETRTTQGGIASTTTVSADTTTASPGSSTTAPVAVDPDESAARSFLDAWAQQDEVAMRAVADAQAVENALGIGQPVGEGFTRCDSQNNGQFECFVDTTAGYEAYLLIGEPGADRGRVWWVGAVAQ